MGLRARLVAALSLVALLAASSPAAANDVLYVSGPGAQTTSYTVPVLVIQEGDTATYLNVDIARHDVRAKVIGPDAPWCTTFPFHFEAGACPLFSSKLIGLAQQSPIYGIERTVAMQTYEYICTIHPGMKGTLLVLPQ